MDKKLQSAFNTQIKNEFYSAHLYLSMAAYSEAKNLPGFAHWLKVQYKEELSHGMKIFEFLNDRGARVVLEDVPKPTSDFDSPQNMFEEALAHEKKVTALLDNLYKSAHQAGDNAASIFLQWFITEQVEEEKNATYIVETLKLIKPGSSAIIMLDRQLAKREG